MKQILFFLIIISTLTTCSNLADGEEILYLKANGCYMPIYTRGNPDAETYVIWTHGGPGSSGLYYGDIDEIAVLHDDYRVIYWDQMGSGGSTGNPDEDDYTLANFTSHLEGVINIVQNRYNPTNTVLLGHSWGGFLASWYLVAEGDTTLAGQRQDELDGLILLNPILNISESLSMGIDYIKGDGVSTGYAIEQINAGTDVDFWEGVLDWYDSHVDEDATAYGDAVYGEDVATHYGYIEEAGGMLVDRDRNDELAWELGLDMVLFSPFHFYDYYNNQVTIRTYLDILDKSLGEDVTANVSGINMPFLFIAGEDDKIAFELQSNKWSTLMGAPGTNKEYSLLPDCAHAAFLDVPECITGDVMTFLATDWAPLKP